MTLLAIPAALGSDTPGVLAFCLALTIALFWYVLYIPEHVAESTEKTRLAFLRERKESIYENLRDLNFEFKAGKVPEDDYREMRASLEDEAAAVLSEINLLESDAGRAPADPDWKGARS